jgi:hypothetical protein
MDLRLPDVLASKAMRFPESSYGATTVTLVLVGGRRIPHVVLGGGTDIVQVGGQTITSPDQLGFRIADIRDVLPEVKSHQGCGTGCGTVAISMIVGILILVVL